MAQKFNIRFQKNNWWGLLAFAGAGSLVYIFLFFSLKGEYPFKLANADVFIFSMLLSAICYISYFLLNRITDRYFNWRKHFALRFFILLTSSAFSFYFICHFILYIYITYVAKVDFEAFSISIENERLKFQVILAVFSLFAVLIDFSWYSYNSYAVTQIQSQQIKREQLNLQFEALKSQLSPHFLFNSLNTISYLIYKDKRIAEKFIRHLAITFQHLLTNKQQKLVSLKEEIEMVRSYTYLLEIRFEHAFKLHVEIDANYLHRKMPTLAIQMLVENAVKHNVVSEEDPLIVQIFSNPDGSITVKNKVRSKPVHVIIDNSMLRKPVRVASHQLGLANIQTRYAFFTDQQVAIHKDEFFSVTLPLI